MVGRIRDIDVPAAVHRHAEWLVEPRGAACAIAAPLDCRIAGQCAHHPAGCYFADGVVVLVRDIDVPAAVHCHAARKTELGCTACAIAAAKAAWLTRKRRDHPGRCHLADGLIVSVGDIDIPAAIYRHAGRSVELRGTACSIVASRAAGCQARQRGHHPTGCHLADRIVVLICDIDVPTAVHRHPGRKVESGILANAIAAAAGERLARQGSDHPGGCHLADGMVACVRDIHVPATVHRHPGWLVKPRDVARAITSTCDAGQARERAHHPGGCHLADGMVAGVRDIHVPAAVHRHAGGREKPRCCACTIDIPTASGHPGKIGPLVVLCTYSRHSERQPNQPCKPPQPRPSQSDQNQRNMPTDRCCRERGLY